MGVRLTLLRHGQTDSSKNQLFYGHTDTPLNEAGRKEAIKAGQCLKDIAFAAVYASPLSRAKETAAIIMQLNSHPTEIIRDEDLKEIHFGAWEGMRAGDIEVHFAEERRRYLDDLYSFQFPQGEKVSDYYARVQQAIERYLQMHKEGNVLVVAHKGFICSVLSYLLHGDFKSLFKYDLDTGKAALVDCYDGFYMLKALNV